MYHVFIKVFRRPPGNSESKVMSYTSLKKMKKEIEKISLQDDVLKVDVEIVDTKND